MYNNKFSTRLKLLKIDEPGYVAYWKKHFRYGMGINKDIAPMGKCILRGFIIGRRLHHLNVIVPLLSLIYAYKHYKVEGRLKTSINVALMKYFVDLAMLMGDLSSVFK